MRTHSGPPIAECDAIAASCAPGFGPPVPPPEAAHQRSLLPRVALLRVAGTLRARSKKGLRLGGSRVGPESRHEGRGSGVFPPSVGPRR
eukprot:9030302-Pyramimonas_sp.AAC.1